VTWPGEARGEGESTPTLLKVQEKGFRKRAEDCLVGHAIWRKGSGRETRLPHDPTYGSFISEVRIFGVVFSALRRSARGGGGEGRDAGAVIVCAGISCIAGSGDDPLARPMLALSKKERRDVFGSLGARGGAEREKAEKGPCGDNRQMLYASAGS